MTPFIIFCFAILCGLFFLADIRCGGCMSVFPEATLKEMLKPDILPGIDTHEQASVKCPNPGCTSIIYRTVKGSLQSGTGEYVKIDGRVPCDIEQEKDMIAKGKWKKLEREAITVPVEKPKVEEVIEHPIAEGFSAPVE